MNNTFSIERFIKLLNKYNSDYLKANLLSIVGLIVLIGVFLGVAAYSHIGYLAIDTQAGVFCTLFIAGGLIFTSRIFKDLGDKKKAISVLVLPVSHLERFMVAWLYSFVIFQLVFTACFFVIDILVIKFGNNDRSTLLSLFGNNKYYYVFIAYTLLHSLAFLGAIFFKKLHMIKTLLVSFVFIVLLFFVNRPLASFIFERRTAISPPFFNVNLVNTNDYTLIVAQGNGDAIVLGMIFMVTLLLWAAAYFKLKEKQV